MIPNAIIMTMSSRFVRFAAVCALLTAVTTVCIHLLPGLWAGVTTFEQRVALRDDPIYMGRFWIVIVHCVLVVISMCAVGLCTVGRSPMLSGFGFLGFLVFAGAELTRTSLAIFALNRTWRAQYAAEQNEAVLQMLRTVMTAFDGVNATFFFVFSFGFTAGLWCYAAALLAGERRQRRLGAVLTAWGVFSSATLVETALGTAMLSGYLAWVGPGFQPAARAYIGLWLWSAGKRP
jgi:hypothetical protein